MGIPDLPTPPRSWLFTVRLWQEMGEQAPGEVRM